MLEYIVHANADHNELVVYTNMVRRQLKMRTQQGPVVVHISRTPIPGAISGDGRDAALYFPTAIEATPKLVACEECRGTGVRVGAVEKLVVCATCQGTGWLDSETFDPIDDHTAIKQLRGEVNAVKAQLERARAQIEEYRTQLTELGAFTPNPYKGAGLLKGD